jgi:ribosomal protein S27AE
MSGERFVSEFDYYSVDRERDIEDAQGCPHPSEAVSEEFGGPDRRDGSGPTFWFCGECGKTLGLTGRRDSVL